MRHAGKARQAGLKLMGLSLVIVLLIIGVWGYMAGAFLSPVAYVLAAIWGLFFIFCLNFFRDPTAVVPKNVGSFVSPAHGTVDVIDETTEKKHMSGACKRISIFLSVFDVHIQNAPVSGRITYLEHRSGQFVNAMRKDCADCNENVLVGFDSAERSGERVAVRLIAGLLARRIVPWIVQGDEVSKGERISLIQFGSRVDLYLPLDARIEVALGQKVKGGETIMATRG